MLVVSVLYMVANIKGVGIIFEMLLGLPEFWGILIGGLVVTIYVTVGGMYGVTYNQTFQSLVMLFVCHYAAGDDYPAGARRGRLVVSAAGLR